MTLRDDFKSALLTTISDVPFCEHRTNNSFLYFEVDKTIQDMWDKELLPEGICLRPSYGDENEYGFRFYNLKLGEHGWVHITKHLAQAWCRQLGITPPKNILWEDDIWEKYVWNS